MKNNVIYVDFKSGFTTDSEQRRSHMVAVLGGVEDLGNFTRDAGFTCYEQLLDEVNAGVFWAVTKPGGQFIYQITIHYDTLKVSAADHVNQVSFDSTTGYHAMFERLKALVVQIKQ